MTARPSRPARTAGDIGFTLIELTVVMSIMGLLVSLGSFGFTSWRNTAQQQGTADEVVSALRNAATRAVSEGRTYCVAVAADGRSYTPWQYSCGTGTQVAAPKRVQGSSVTLAATVPTTGSLPTPTPACPAGNQCLYFYPRGTAIPAQVIVNSTARTKTYTVLVEGLTARVYK